MLTGPERRYEDPSTHAQGEGQVGIMGLGRHHIIMRACRSDEYVYNGQGAGNK